METRRCDGPGRVRSSRVRCLRRGRPGFTLIEILVVVAIIALLISILLPSLSRARELARATVCLTHLKEFGTALAMYQVDSREMLPGPMHPAMFTNVVGSGISEFLQRQHLPRMLRKYFADKGKNTFSIVDELARCPSFPVADDTFPPFAASIKPMPFHYAINTWTYSGPHYYFGFINASYTSYEQWASTMSGLPGGLKRYLPKKISQIKNVQREWAIADAFRRPWPDEVTGWDPLAQMRWGGHGSWQRDQLSERTDQNSGNSLLNSPYHLGRGHALENGTYIYLGRAQTLYFDMHAESQRGFRGTVNPVSATNPGY